MLCPFSTLLVSWHSHDSGPEVTSLAPVSCQLFTIPPWSLARDQKFLGASCCLITSTDTPITVVGCGNLKVWNLGGQSYRSATYHWSRLCPCRWDFYVTTSSFARWQPTLLIQDNSTKSIHVWFKGWQHVDTWLNLFMSLVFYLLWVYMLEIGHCFWYTCSNGPI